MKPIGIRPGSLRLGWQDAQRVAGEIGFDGIEPTIDTPDDVARLLTRSGADEVERWIVDTGCAVCSLSIGCYIPLV